MPGVLCGAVVLDGPCLPTTAPGPVEFSLWRANSLSGIARDLELQQRLTGALGVLPDPADADALRVWWMTLPQRWG